MRSMGFTKAAFWVGVASSAMSVVLYIALKVMTPWAQSQNPSERNLGLAALGIIFGVPLRFCAAAAVLCLLASAAAFAYRRMFRRDHSGQPGRTAS